METSGKYYSFIRSLPNPYGPGLKYTSKDLGCIRRTLSGLQNLSKAGSPGLLLGRIQSGKTKSFIGLIALAFDNGYDVVVVLTKNSEALATQTARRLSLQFGSFGDAVNVRDIIVGKGQLPDDFADSKLILVAKKQHKNLDYLATALTGDGSLFAGKKVLIVDDEADSASVAFSGGSKKDKEGRKALAELRIVAKKIDALRRSIKPKPSFLQVTATPYSLLLQNKGPALKHDISVQSLRPSFVELVPLHDDYFGGDHYFGQISQNSAKPESLMHRPVSEEEMKLLRTCDSVAIEGVDISDDGQSFPALLGALVNFVVAGSIRRLQQAEEGLKDSKLSNFAMLLHTEPSKTAHAWQAEVAKRLLGRMRDAAASRESKALDALLKVSYDNLSSSLKLEGIKRPDFSSVALKAKEFLRRGLPRINVVNSDKDISELLDPDSGELKLEAALTLFVAGQYMDRGVTVPNLISFFYGRSPKTFQQDTVLQHCRMFGSRYRPEVAVTRFYTTERILGVLREMHINDTILRDRIEEFGVDDKVLQMLQSTSSGQVKFCSFDKIRASRIRVINGESKLWPRGFTLKSPDALEFHTQKVENLLDTHGIDPGNNGQVLVDAEYAIKILKDLSKSFQGFAPQYENTWNESEISQLISQLSDPLAGRDSKHQGKVFIVVRCDRDRPNQFARQVIRLDSPDNPKEDMEPCRELAKLAPVLLLTLQNGKIKDGWGGEPFWWPVFFPPFDNNCYMYAAD
jgi:hypothetical protein